MKKDRLAQLKKKLEEKHRQLVEEVGKNCTWLWYSAVIFWIICTHIDYFSATMQDILTKLMSRDS